MKNGKYFLRPKARKMQTLFAFATCFPWLYCDSLQAIALLTNQTTLQMYPPSHVLVFALGCIGALAPEIVRFYRQRYRPPKSIFSLWYFLTTAVYAALGGVVALMLPAVTLWGALYAGISTPVLISTAAKHREPKIVEAANERRMRDNIIKATDHSREMANYLPAKRNIKASWFGSFIEFIQNNADGLFE